MLFIYSGDPSQSQAGLSQWMTAPEISAAAITALFTLAAILFKDYLLKRINEGRSDRKSEAAIYRRYSNPLVTSTVSLLHRLNEILFVEHRPIYLKKTHQVGPKQGLGRSYVSYKKFSTIYRLAAVLGWIRACRREFSYLRIADPEGTQLVDDAIVSFEKALADGGWVEQERVHRLYELWQLGNSGSLSETEGIERLGTKVNNVFWEILEATNKEKKDSPDLEREIKIRLCRMTADCITSHLKTNPITDAALDRTWEEALNIITMREAWIYRDWQSAIGDVMTRRSQADERHFEVIGYGEFELFLASGTDAEKLAVERLLSIFDGLDLSIEDRFDCRPRQLRSVARSTAEIILAIHRTQGRRSIVPQYSVDLASEVIRKVAQ
jgi:hypothetical protein